MQDRFKFRVYIKYAKMMCYDVNSFYIDRLKNKITIHFDDHTKTFKFDDIVLEQSTGLKDRNGRLIYEGDIFDNISIDEQYEVRWDEDTARFCFITDNEIYDFDNFDVTAFEVIGNIHENKEVIK